MHYTGQAGGNARGAAQGNLPGAAKTAPDATIEGGLPGEHGNLPALVIRAGSLRFLASSTTMTQRGRFWRPFP